ncbi:MAG: ABC transporter permease [Fibrobacter sp.]|jgi:phospholipid/cholesterol/gamma-HCH transport system permease protein|nr:ABC transporter permease [Fibrobacter sp.]
MKNERTANQSLSFPGRIFSRLGNLFLSSPPGKLCLLFVQVIASLFQKKYSLASDVRSIKMQTFFFGVELFPALFVVATLFGTVVIVEAMTVMSKVGFSDSFGNLMVIVIIRELSPILTAFFIAGRSGSALTTHIGSMQINHEADALATMGINPVRYLVMPALFGGILAMVAMNLFFSFSAIFSGFFVIKCVDFFVGNWMPVQLSLSYLGNAIISSMSFMDVVMIIVKPVVFAVLIVLNASEQAFSIKRDIREVPQATSRSVIYSFLYVVVADVLLSGFYIFQYLEKVSKII